jgi:hypothetical protein
MVILLSLCFGKKEKEADEFGKKEDNGSREELCILQIVQ